jgi:hypothetical protein
MMMYKKSNMELKDIKLLICETPAKLSRDSIVATKNSI